MDVLDELERRFVAAIEAEGLEEAAADERAGRPRLARLRATAGRARGRLRPRALPLATAGALAALAVVAAVVLVIAAGGGGGGEAPERRALSSLLLERVAQAAEHAPPPPVLREGELWYVRGEGVDQWALRGRRVGTRGFEAYGVLRRFAVERWSGLGSEGRVRRLTLSAAPRFERDRRWWDASRRSGSPFPPDRDVLYTRVAGLPLQDALFPPDSLRDLPTEPGALLGWLEALVERRAALRDAPSLDRDGIESATFEAIRELLLLPVAPAQRAALLRAFGRLPGTRVPRIGSDARGRPGAVLVYTPRTHPRLPRVLVVDVETGRLLAERGPRNSVETTYVAQGVAAGVTALPRGVRPPKADLPRTGRAETPPRPVPGER